MFATYDFLKLARGAAHEAAKDGWVVISMKNDWNRIFSFDQ
jgi:hypothetical protein